ncbi:MAG: LysR substrate-binding domain-containing protein, partial [Parasphingorhabdus sp.]
SLDSVRQMAASGLGLGILPALYIRSEITHGADVAVLDIEGWNASRSIAIAWRSGAGFADQYHAVARRIADEAKTLLKQVEQTH